MARTPNNELFSTLSHPLRPRILRAAAETTSPKELAVALQQPIGVVSYHVRTLADAGLLELVRTEPRRGALEHYYRVPRGARTKLRKAADELRQVADALPR